MSKAFSHFVIIFLLISNLYPTPLFAQSSSFALCRLAWETGGSCYPLPKANGLINWGEQFVNAVLDILRNTLTPTITNVSPFVLPQDSTATLLITAPSADFISNTILTASDGIEIQSYQIISATQISANVVIPASTPTGFYDFQAQTQWGTETQTVKGQDKLQVIAGSSTPEVLSINPMLIPVDSNNVSMLIHGYNTHFDATSSVDFADSAITSNQITAHSETLLEVSLNVPTTARIGFHNVTVTTGSEVAEDTQIGPLQIIDDLPIPKITAINYNQGFQGVPQTTLKLTAENTHFENATTTVSFSGSGINVTQVQVNSATEVLVTIAIDDDAPLGIRDIFVTTGAETAALLKGFGVFAQAIFSLNVTEAKQRQTVSVMLTGQNTHFEAGVTTVDFGAGITVSKLQVINATILTAELNVATDASVGLRTVSVTTGDEIVVVPSLFAVQAGDNLVIVKKAGLGSGTITSNPSGIDCGQQCDFALSGDVSLSANANSNSVFNGWSGDCSGTQTSVTLSNIDSDKTCTATFDLRPIQLNLTVQGSGNVTVNALQQTCSTSCSYSLKSQETVTLTPEADAGFHFTGFTGDSDCTDGQITLNSDTQCTAQFEQNGTQPTLTVLKSGNGEGAVNDEQNLLDCGQQCVATYTANQSVKLTATPTLGNFVAWQGDCSGTDNPLTIDLDQSKVCTAIFERDQASVMITVEGQGSVSSQPQGIDCSDSCTASFTLGTDIALLAQPTSNFERWEGDCADTSATIQFLLDGNKQCKAIFTTSLPSQTLTLNITGSGRITSNPDGVDCVADSLCQTSFKQGEQITLIESSGENITLSGDTGCEAVPIQLDQDLTCYVQIGDALPPSTQTGISLLVSSHINENATSLPASIERLGDATTNLTVQYTTEAITATEGRDYMAVSGELTWLSGETHTQSFVIPLYQDSATEGTETFKVVVRNATTGAILQEAIVAIVDAQIQTPSCPNQNEINWLCDANWETLDKLTLLGQRANAANVILTNMVTNKGRIGNATLEQDAILENLDNAIITGTIINKGIIINGNFRGGTLSGGTLQGHIISKDTGVDSIIKNVKLAPETQLTGGILEGTIIGDSESPALLTQLRVRNNTYLNHVTLGEGVVLGANVTLGTGIKFSDYEQIPQDFDVMSLMSTYKPEWDCATQITYPKSLDVTQHIFTTHSVLEGINDIPLLQENGWHLVHDSKHGYIYLDIEQACYAVMPMTMQQTIKSARLENKSWMVNFITANKLKVETYPVLQAPCTLHDALQAMALSGFIVRDNGQLSVPASDTYWYSVQPQLAALPTEETEVGLVFNVSPYHAHLPLAQLVFERDEQYYKQVLASAPAFVSELEDKTKNFAMDGFGLVEFEWQNQVYTGVLDYVVKRLGEELGVFSVQMTGDVNGDGIDDFVIRYRNGDEQVGFVLP